MRAGVAAGREGKIKKEGGKKRRRNSFGEREKKRRI